MNEHKLDWQAVEGYLRHLAREERSPGTIEKYRRDVTAFFRFLAGRGVDRQRVCAWRRALLTGGRAPVTVNAMLAAVEQTKVFPHNLRHLFARTFYRVSRDVAKLADVLGHSDLSTTRIYLVSTGAEHARELERMGLVQ